MEYNTAAMKFSLCLCAFVSLCLIITRDLIMLTLWIVWIGCWLMIDLMELRGGYILRVCKLWVEFADCGHIVQKTINLSTCTNYFLCGGLFVEGFCFCGCGWPFVAGCGFLFGDWFFLSMCKPPQVVKYLIGTHNLFAFFSNLCQ